MHVKSQSCKVQQMFSWMAGSKVPFFEAVTARSGSEQLTCCWFQAGQLPGRSCHSPVQRAPDCANFGSHGDGFLIDSSYPDRKNPEEQT